MSAKELHRRVSRRMQGIERPRQEHRDRPRLGEGANPGLAGVFQMIGRQRAISRGKAGSAEIRELLRVKLHRQPQRAGALEHALDLGGGEGDTLAEAVHRIDEALRMSSLQGRQAYLVEIGVGAAAVLRGDRVGAEEARAHPHRTLGGDSTGRAQHGELGLDIEAVARLDLDGRDALCEQRIDPGKGAGKERVRSCLPGRFDGGEDPAAGPGDVLVAHPLEPHLELARAVAAVHDMGVAVDQRGRDQTALQVAPRPGRVVVGHRIRPPAPGDASAVHRHRALWNQAIGPHSTLHGGQCRIGQDFRGHSLDSLNVIFDEGWIERSSSGAGSP